MTALVAVACFIGDSNQGSQWLDGQELTRQIAYNRVNGNVDGSIFYGYSALKNNVLGIRDSVTGLFE